MSEHTAEIEAPCCPGGWLSGHAYWCTSDTARALRLLGSTTVTAPDVTGSAP